MTFSTNYQIPNKWKCKKLNEVGQFDSGGTPSKEEGKFWERGVYPFVTGADVTELYVSAKNARSFLTEEGLYSGRTAVCKPSTLLFVTRTGVGRIGIASEVMGASQDISPYTCGPEIIPEFACRYLQGIASYLVNNTRGSTIKGLTRDFIESIEIPLPPINEQQRIVSWLNEKLEAVERAQSASEEQEVSSKELHVSILQSVFREKVIRNQPHARITDLANIQTGYAFKSEWFSKTGIRLLRNANVFQGYVAWDDQVCLPENRRHEFAKFELHVGDIVLSLDRPIVSGGLKVARISAMDLPALLLQRVARFQIKGPLDPAYLYLYLRSPSFTRAITGHAFSIGVPHVSPKQVGDVEIPLPSLERQKEIVNHIERRLSEATLLSQRLESQKMYIDSLSESIFKKAFCGEV